MKKKYISPLTEVTKIMAGTCFLAGSGVPNSDQDDDGGSAKKHFHVEQEAHFTFPTSNDGVNGTAFSPWED